MRERESQIARHARSAEEALELLASVSRAANTAVDLRALALNCLIQSGRAAGCQFGQLWHPEPRTDVIKCLANSYFGYPEFADLHVEISAGVECRTLLTRYDGAAGGASDDHGVNEDRPLNGSSFRRCALAAAG